MVLPGDPSGLYIAFQHGEIRRFDIETKRFAEEAAFFDITAKIRLLSPLGDSMKAFQDERGLLGITPHPHYAVEGSPFFETLLVSYCTGPPPSEHSNHLSVLSRFRRQKETVDGSRSGWDEEQVLLDEQPEMNHNGGTLSFGPAHEDTRSGIGYLYYGVGDGGGAGDRHGRLLDEDDPESFLGNAQDLDTHLGKLLRLDVNVRAPRTYLIPAENPRGKAGGNTTPCPILPYAYGLRNPWNFSFDGDRLFLPDVGQSKREEVNLIEDTSAPAEEGGKHAPLRNFGWRALEGGVVFGPDNLHNAAVLQHIGGVRATVPPILEYDRTGQRISAVIGGAVYRGRQVPVLRGAYVFGDYNGQIFYARQHEGTGKWAMQPLAGEITAGNYIHGFATDSTGEMYVMSVSIGQASANTWRLQKIVAADLGQREIDAILDRAVSVAASGKVSSTLRRTAEGDQPEAATTPKIHVTVHTVSGHVSTRSMPHAWPASEDIARRKAYTGMAFSSDENAMSSRSIGELSQPGLQAATPEASSGGAPLYGIGTTNPSDGIVQFPGGMPIYKGGHIVGGIGVSGDDPEVDEQIALFTLGERYAPPSHIRIDTVTRKIRYQSHGGAN